MMVGISSRDISSQGTLLMEYEGGSEGIHTPVPHHPGITHQGCYMSIYHMVSYHIHT